MAMAWNKFNNRSHFIELQPNINQNPNQFFECGLFSKYYNNFLGSVIAKDKWKK